MRNKMTPNSGVRNQFPRLQLGDRDSCAARAVHLSVALKISPVYSGSSLGMKMIHERLIKYSKQSLRRYNFFPGFLLLSLLSLIY